MRRDRVVEVLAEVLARRERERAPVRTSRVVGRNQDGTLQLQRTDAECVARGSISDAYTGEVVLEQARPPLARRGTAGVALLAAAGSSSVLWVERLDPSFFRAGAAYDVVVIGRGFTPGTIFEFLRPTGATNDDITILERTFLDEESFGLSIEVAADAVFYRAGAPLAYWNPGGS